MSSDDLSKLGICRCCLSIGFFKSISEAYMWSGENEIYDRILKECFNIMLKPLPFTILQNTICEVCIVDLRSAYKFRKKVIRSEKAVLKKSIKIMEGFKGEGTSELNDAVILHVDEHVQSDNEDVGNVIERPNIKLEIESLDEDKKYLKKIKTECEIYNKPYIVKKRDDEGETMSELNDTVLLHVGEHGLSDDGNVTSVDDDQDVKMEIEVDENDSETKRETYLSESKHKNPDSVKKGHANRSDQKKRVLLRKDMTSNINIIIKNSTVLPFRYSCSRSYLCFYCSRSFTDHGLLRSHTLQHKDYPKLSVIVRKQLQTKLVYVDVTDLSCKLCMNKMKNYPTLKEHLIKTHKIEFKKVQEGLVPFKLKDGDIFDCQICKNSFNGFQNLSIHLNEHYEYCTCSACGANFLSESRLVQHKKITGHLLDPQDIKKKTHKCHCGIVFTSNYLKRKHEIYDHNMEAKMHECKECDMKFLLGNSLRRHVRMTHLNEKNYKCPICGKGFYSKRGLEGHSIVHTGEKKFKCDICFKLLGRKKSLINHFRMHNGESRFMCDICGKGFIQKPNLAYHMRRNHPEAHETKMPRKASSVLRRFQIIPPDEIQVFKDSSGDSKYVVQI